MVGPRPREGYLLTMFREAREGAGIVLSGLGVGPTHVRTTPNLAFRAVVGTKREAAGMEVVL